MNISKNKYCTFGTWTHPGAAQCKKKKKAKTCSLHFISDIMIHSLAALVEVYCQTKN